MVRASILFAILIVCVIGTKARASRHRNTNSNVNTNSFRRNANTNVNTNSFSRRSLNSNINSNTFGGGGTPLGYRQGGIGNGDPDGEASFQDDQEDPVANDITRCLASAYGSFFTDDDLDEISDFLREIAEESPSRRSTNANSNTNTFGAGTKTRRPKFNRNADFDQDADYGLGPDVIHIPTLESVDEIYGTEQNINRNTNTFGGAGDDDKDIFARLVNGGGINQLGRKRKRVNGSRLGGNPTRRGSANYNSNTNSFGGGNERNNEIQELLEDSDLQGVELQEPETRRSRMRNSNSNINTNVFRRNLNRNVNVNSNTNRKLKG